MRVKFTEKFTNPDSIMFSKPVSFLCGNLHAVQSAYAAMIDHANFLLNPDRDDVRDTLVIDHCLAALYKNIAYFTDEITYYDMIWIRDEFLLQLRTLEVIK